ncbi:MAG TPA: hypothetical protein VKB35_17435 [Ktedonobacteraceae bacterium]|nr:hypothetical protein [Ktedonobacteraceae bacterium]
MNPMVVEYIGIVVAALILGWAVVELNRRYFCQRKQDVEALNTWIKIDPTRASDVNVDELLPGADSDSERKDAPKPELHTRAQQNGHYSESTKPL